MCTLPILSRSGLPALVGATLLAASSFAPIFSLSASPPPGRAQVDPAWSAVVTLGELATRMPVTPVGIVADTRAQAAKARTEREARALKFRATAQSAREFHTLRPSHAQAADARKLEALAGLEGITPNDKGYERSALAVATAFRTNRVNPAADRFEVAHAIEGRGIRQKTLGRPWFANPVLAEQMLDRLHQEFGERPEVWAAYLSLAQNTCCDAGPDVAHRIAQSPCAPEPTKVAARQLLGRYALVGQPLDFPLTPTQGRATTLAQLAGKTTIVLLWDGTRQPAGPPGLQSFKQSPRPNTHWVYVSLGDLGAPPKGRKPLAAPAGTTCVEPLGWRSPIATKLQLTRLPYVLVLDERRRLSGYGRVEEIPALLAGIGRRLLP